MIWWAKLNNCFNKKNFLNLNEWIFFDIKIYKTEQMPTAFFYNKQYIKQ